MYVTSLTQCMLLEFGTFRAFSAFRIATNARFDLNIIHTMRMSNINLLYQRHHIALLIDQTQSSHGVARSSLACALLPFFMLLRFLEIIRVFNLAKEKWGGRKVSEGLVGRFLKEVFSAKKFYRNIDLASKAQHATGQLTIFITMPGVVNSTRGRRVKLEDLRDLEKAKYMFFPGYGSGSLVDLVVGRHGTSFLSDFVGVWASNPNEVTGNNVRKDRTSGRGGFRWV